MLLVGPTGFKATSFSRTGPIPKGTAGTTVDIGDESIRTRTIFADVYTTQDIAEPTT